MKKRQLGIGLIGVGRHGMRYARHLLHDAPTAALKAVCRRHPEQGLDLPGAEAVSVYGEVRALIDDPSVEAIPAGLFPRHLPAGGPGAQAGLDREAAGGLSRGCTSYGGISP